jgi:hypothetical protein
VKLQKNLLQELLQTPLHADINFTEFVLMNGMQENHRHIKNVLLVTESCKDFAQPTQNPQKQKAVVVMRWVAL